MTTTYRLHSDKQTEAYFSDKKVVLCASGIQWGKSTVGALRTRRYAHRFSSPTDNFLIVAPTYKILNQSTLKAFMNVFGDLGRYNSSRAEYSIPRGPTFFFRTGHDADSVVGITNVRHVWGDEAGLFSLYFWENLQARASFKKAPITLTTSPYSQNWVYKELIRPYQKGLRDDICLIQATSKDNPYFPAEEYENRKRTMDLRRFKMIYGGEFDKPEGLVYDNFGEEHIIESLPDFKHNLSISYYGGIDWGHRDPFVLITRAVSSFGDQYDISEFYKTGMRPSQIVELMKQKNIMYNYKRIWADPSRPEMIEELQKAGIPVIGAENEIQKGIDAHYELISSGRYKIARSLKYAIDEYDCYHYPEETDIKPDTNRNKERLEKPVDQSNHAMDSIRYLSLALKTGGKKNVPRIAQGY